MDEKELLTQILDTNCGYVDEIPADKMADRLIAAGVALPVRCRECECAYINSLSAATGVAVCRRWSSEAETVIMNHDDYCSYGKRRLSPC